LFQVDPLQGPYVLAKQCPGFRTRRIIDLVELTVGAVIADQCGHDRGESVQVTNVLAGEIFEGVVVGRRQRGSGQHGNSQRAEYSFHSVVSCNIGWRRH
jgi:hypothetical protein